MLDHLIVTIYGYELSIHRLIQLIDLFLDAGTTLTTLTILIHTITQQCIAPIGVPSHIPLWSACKAEFFQVCIVAG